MPPQSEFLGANEVASALGISRSTAYRVMREMGRVRVGRVVRVSREKFEAWIDAHTESRRDKKRRNVDERQLGLFSSRR